MEPVHGRTPLHEALAPGSALVATLWWPGSCTGVPMALLRAGALPTWRDCRGETPINYALNQRNTSVLGALLACETRPGRAELSRALLRTLGGPSEGEVKQVAWDLPGCIRVRDRG